MSQKTFIPLNELAKALFTINRHAKTAPEPRHLYYIKKESINRLLKENRAEKIGLHFSNHPKLSNQHSTLLVKVGDYFFHIPPAKEDFKQLSHLGELDKHYRNPPAKMSLSQAKKIIYRYIDWKPPKQRHSTGRNYKSACFTPSSLGKIDWPAKKTRRNSRSRY
ncbi:YkyB family protein [Lentibacillus juripiscarius]|uniref:YkyB family protein n=1 Tax=Lentibacillus juripiscarius TaxID=257446 RepID=A0ABW5V991_9BACI